MFGLFNKKYKLGYMEAHIVDYCNLKCDYCGHYCHLIDEKIFIDVNEFTRDITELSKKVFIYQIVLLGGEPLLHPQINEFIKSVRNVYPVSRIGILSNGILIPAMKDDFWETVVKNKIYIDISKYPVCNKKFSSYLDIIAEKGAKIGRIHVQNKFWHKLNENGSADSQASYKACASKYALNLWHGKLYNCQAVYRYYYNKICNKNIPLPPGIDIYKSSGKQIHDFFGRPTEACKYCNEISEEINWRQYRKS